MTVLAALDVTKAYGERLLLEGVSLTLEDGERVGVVGRNGAGKSTLAKILAGVETPDTGSVATRRGARVAYLAQEPILDGERTEGKDERVLLGTDANGRDAQRDHERYACRVHHGAWMPLVMAYTTNPAALRAPVFNSRLLRWKSTVRGETKSRAAISGVVSS